MSRAKARIAGEGKDKKELAAIRPKGFDNFVQNKILVELSPRGESKNESAILRLP